MGLEFAVKASFSGHYIGSWVGGLGRVGFLGGELRIITSYGR